ncbi:MAG: OmpA family protein [Woeseia sp.]|nr:OmpA family protein [Woeseia sp.]MBT8097875.1 OmpA family protein [Woeseia sp.]NNE60269.1 OmpA family protein [Woeseia sp.]NNL54293.1 OmpA family protein [Woeseia sp.]
MVFKIRFLAVSLGVLVLFSSALAQNALRETFFGEADAALELADAANAELLSPRNYERATEAFEDAEEGLRRGRNIEYVRDKTSEAAEYYSRAAEAAKLARTVLAQVMKSRQDAANAKAPQLAAEQWQDAQREFADAIRYLERGDLKRSKRLDIEATAHYRDAELTAIKAQYLTETRQLLEDADRARVGRYAPATLEKAQKLLADAERELNENRYDTDMPRNLAQQANYEARHAIHLSEVVRKVRDRDLSTEQLILDWEKPLREIAGAADVVPDMATGPDELQATLVDFVETLRADKQRLEQQNEEYALRLAETEEEISALDERLGGATEERAALVQRLEAQARIKAQFEEVEKLFGREEARVFREGDTIILRLVGLTFDSGQSEIKQESFNLLAKVERAIDLFPRSELVIEGHTDSHGSDELNQKLSQDRAGAVQQYMINAMRLPDYRLIATGFGETQPVANNETAAGRARNRRIDIIIKPDLESSAP